MFGKQLYESISLEKAAHAGFLQSQGKSLEENWQPTETTGYVALNILIYTQIFIFIFLHKLVNVL